MKLSLEIVYEDDSIVVVNKPPHFLSIPDRYRPELYNVYNMLQEKYGEIYTVHRIDKETSGIMVFARTPEAHKHLNDQFVNRETSKIYLAVIDGVPYEDEGTIDKPIKNNPGKSGQMMVHPDGKASLSKYTVIEKFKRYAVVDVQIFTGRTHQIRVHLKSIGHPLMIDNLYGNTEAFYLSSIKKKRFNLEKQTEEKPLMSRTCLHAKALGITHPATGKKVKFEAPLPKDIKALLNQLRKLKA